MALSLRRFSIFAGISTVLLAACVQNTDTNPGEGGGGNGTTTPSKTDPGAVVEGQLPPEKQAELDKLMAEINDSANMTPAEFQDLYAVPFTGLTYDPKSADHLDLLQNSALALDDDELSKLAAGGFVISDKKRFPTFGYGYASIYAADLPLYISADSVLFAVHRSYDEMLEAVEYAVLIPELSNLLSAMRNSLANGGAGSLGADARADTDLFLAIASGLLTGTLPGSVAGASDAEMKSIFDAAKAAEGEKDILLFGAPRHLDFSQFKPRGHYTDSPELERYFRAMMWLGRIDFRFLEPDEAGKLILHRRQLEGAFALGELMGQKEDAQWNRIDGVIRAFVGKPDYMVVPELSSLAADFGVTDPGDIANIPDSKVAQTILNGGYGSQQISSQIMINGTGKGTLPLSSSFAFFGQRYVVDSHVFSNVVYDRVAHGSVFRMMPNPLDVAFAAFGNDQAGVLLSSEIQKYNYAPDLHAMRILVDAHGDGYWNDNLYNLWMSSLRTLSPNDETADTAAAGLPGIAGTEPWGRRLINTQLASWAELRHDTILYAKQSYTGGASCEFPDAYVDPYPKFFGALSEFAERGHDIVANLDFGQNQWISTSAKAYFDNLLSTSQMLGSMAEHERTGEPFNAEQMAFVNQAVKVQEGCGDPEGIEGWYSKLFYDAHSAVSFDPTIADVHTQPTDEAGNMVGNVLHVGTGHARLLVVTTDTCVGPRAYVGLASSYFEEITSNFHRMDDIEWADKIKPQSPPDVPWMNDLVSH